MVTFTPDDLQKLLHALRWPLRLTWAGMVAERAAAALWPLLSICLLALAALMLGLQDLVSVEIVWAAMALLGGGALAALVYGALRFRLPRRAEALARLDASMQGHPLAALRDEQVIGRADAASNQVWQAHQQRMAQRARSARAVPGDLRVARRDPYALRYVALLAFMVALLFGSVWRVGSVAGMAPGSGGAGLASGPVWEGWAEPPRYTGRPTLYLNDQAEGAMPLPKGTLITLRFYGAQGALDLAESVSGRGADAPAGTDPAQDFTVLNAGDIAIEGPGGRSWQVAVIPDSPPQIEGLGAPEVSALGEMALPYRAQDDYGVAAGEARISLNLAAVDRRHGLGPAPDPRPEIIVPLAMPIAGDRRDFEEKLTENFSQHAWANLPVTLSLSVLDAAEQQAVAVPQEFVLPGRRFFDPVAAAVIEMRRDLLWTKGNGARISPILRAISYRAEDLFRSQTSALRLQKLIGRIETLVRFDHLDEAAQEELASALWDLALELEEGDLADALERLRRAKERLQEAMKNGASDEEIAELMQELRRASEAYMQQLRRQQAEEGESQPAPEGETMQMTQDDLQRMMDRIQELMEQGRMDEAEQALRELQELMENMRMTEGQQGEGGDSPGEQAMEGLSDSLREQQGLSDQAFRDLQEQYNPGAQSGQSQGNEGRNGGQGRGESHEGQGGDAPGESQGQGEGEQQGDQGNGREGGTEQSLAERQRALRDELRRQQQNLPGQGSPEGEAARGALDRAGRAMDGAEEALRQGDLPGAIDQQAQAMDALRDGIQSLGEAMQQAQQNQQPGQGAQQSDRQSQSRDPLGRQQGQDGGASEGGPLAGTDDPHGQARRLLDEIRRRSAEQNRPKLERDYLDRLLDRF
ncbi:MAG: TIGR02302 family protein [Sulfitobacter sp.]